MQKEQVNIPEPPAGDHPHEASLSLAKLYRVGHSPRWRASGLFEAHWRR